MIASGHTRANNIGGLDGTMHRVAFSLPAWKSLPAGATYELDMVYYLPISGPANYTVKINNVEYAFSFEQPDLPVADLTAGGNTEVIPAVTLVVVRVVAQRVMSSSGFPVRPKFKMAQR